MFTIKSKKDVFTVFWTITGQRDIISNCIYLFISDANSPAIAGRLATKRPNEMSQQSAASPKMAKM